MPDSDVESRPMLREEELCPVPGRLREDELYSVPSSLWRERRRPVLSHLRETERRPVRDLCGRRGTVLSRVLCRGAIGVMF